MTQRLAVACARHPWRTVASWIGAIVTNDPESLRANDLQSERFPQQEGFDELVIAAASVRSGGERDAVALSAVGCGSVASLDRVRTDQEGGERVLLALTDNAVEAVEKMPMRPFS